MTLPRFLYVPIMDHELHVTAWGSSTKPALVMWHGLARTGRDFDEIASALSDEFFVICPDTIGRGLSSWSDNPDAEYSIEYYSGIAADLLDQLDIQRAGWLGTSMGGLIGMRMASGPLAERLEYLIINDIGPEIPQPAVDRILQYASIQVEFLTLREAEDWFRAAYGTFGPQSDEFWKRLTRSSVRRKSDGRLTTHFDPRIMAQFSASREEIESWDRYEKISLPTHVLRGSNSDILTAKIAEKMSRCGPKPAVTVFENCGHAPTLSKPKEARLLRGVIDKLTGMSG